jgi:hypothetical protein
MRRLLVIVLVALPLALHASDTVVSLKVTPMAAPKPALKYALLPEVHEMTSGNPAQWYIRCFQEQNNFFFNKEVNAERARYRTMKLSELPGEQLRKYGGGALTQCDYGARLDALDWQMIDRVHGEGADLRMTELGPFRILGTALQVRMRGCVAVRAYDEVAGSAKTMFTFARHLGECPVGAANRLGLEVANLCLDSLEEMWQQPDCPNLYWAYTDLPSPLVDLRKGFQGDNLRIASDLRKLRSDPMTDAALEDIVSRLSGAIGFQREQVGVPPRSLRAYLRAALKETKKIEEARNRLRTASEVKDKKLSPTAIFNTLADGAKIKKLSPLQVLLLDEKREFETLRDERMKLLALTPAQIEKRRGELATTNAFADLLPDVIQARQAQARVEQRIALSRCIEALRMYAAANAGKLPATLADCTVPVPDDPYTGKPFSYKLEGETAHLRGAALHAAYQITMK